MRIFLTGASSGIGAAMARQFDAMGAELGLVGRNAQKLEDFAATLNSPERHRTYALDVADRKALSFSTIQAPCPVYFSTSSRNFDGSKTVTDRPKRTT